MHWSPGPRWRAYSAPPDPLAGLRERGKKGKMELGERRGGRLEGVKEGKGGEGKIWERKGEGNGHAPSFSS